MDTRLPCPSPTPGACSNSCPLSRWCHPTMSSSVIPFSSHLQSFLASGSFPMSQFFASGGQSIGALASTSVLPMNFQVTSEGAPPTTTQLELPLHFEPVCLSIFQAGDLSLGLITANTCLWGLCQLLAVLTYLALPYHYLLSTGCGPISWHSYSSCFPLLFHPWFNLNFFFW